MDQNYCTLPVYLSFECINNEVNVKRINTFDALLNDMIAVLIFNTLLYVSIQLVHYFNLNNNIKYNKLVKTF